MKTKTVAFLLVVTFTIAIMISPRNAWAQGTIYITGDGSINPPTAPIQRSGNLYLFTADIYDSIVVGKPSIVIDGNGFKLQGAGAGIGFTMINVNNVSIVNAKIIGFWIGVYYQLGSGNVKVSNVTNNEIGIYIVDSTSVTVTGCNVSNNTNKGIYLESIVVNSVIKGNSIEHNGNGLEAVAGGQITNNNITENTVAYNNVGFYIQNIGPVADNFIFHNNFVNNTRQIFYIPVLPGTYLFGSIWDNGYPSGGNFWSNYTGVDLYSGPSQDILGSDGIGDTPYVITPKDIDHYPLMTPYSTTQLFVLRITATTGGTTNPAPGNHVYNRDEVATVEALPMTDYIFDHWELDNTNVGATNPISVTMNANHALNAVFKTQPDIAVTSVVPYPISVRRGQPVYVDVTVANQRFTSETFDVVVYADKDRKIIGDEIIVGVQTIYNLQPGGTKTITFIWDTSTLPSNTSYYISSKAIVPYDIDPTNNLLTAKKKVTIRR